MSVPKYYVNFGQEYRFTVNAKNEEQACVKCLSKYLERDNLETTDCNTLTVPEKFKVSERGHIMWNDENSKEFSHQRISKLLDDNKGTGGELAYA